MKAQFKNAYLTKDKNNLPLPMFIYAILEATPQEMEAYRVSVESRPNGKVVIDENVWADGLQTIKNPFFGKTLFFRPGTPLTNEGEAKNTIVELEFSSTGNLLRKGSEDDLFAMAFKSAELTNKINTEARVAASQTATTTKRVNPFAVMAEKKAAEEAAKLAEIKAAEDALAQSNVQPPVGEPAIPAGKKVGP